MGKRSSKGRVAEIRGYILDLLEEGKIGLSENVGAKFGISRQAAHRHLQKMVKEGVLKPIGETRNRVYKIRPLEESAFSLKLSGKLQEDVVWRERILPMLKEVPENVRSICEYGFTEIFNNAVDHSSGTRIVVSAERTGRTFQMIVSDNGIGIFNKIRQEFRLGHPREAILELSKGKLTTDPKHHSGEGIFFCIRSFDDFSILSGTLFFRHLEPNNDWLIENQKERKGTSVFMVIRLATTTDLKTVFAKYASDEEEYSFSRTHVPVALARVGEENLVSRSQAKRLLSRFEKFTNVILDFNHVDSIGQAFADEIFRVYAQEHPKVQLVAINANDQVQDMIKRAGGVI